MSRLWVSKAKFNHTNINCRSTEKITPQKEKQLNEVKGKSSEDIAATIIPIVRRLYNENIKLMPTMQSLFEDYIRFLNGDMEAFLCEAYTKDFVRRLKNV